jgi:hypothetical protein
MQPGIKVRKTKNTHGTGKKEKEPAGQQQYNKPINNHHAYLLGHGLTPAK